MTKPLAERVSVLETTVESQGTSMAGLTDAIKELTATLERGKGIAWFIGILVAVGVAIGPFIQWLIMHVVL